MISALILAAGASERMGSAKALLKLGGATLLERIVGTAGAAGTGDVVVTVGPPHGPEICAALAAALPAVRWAWNAQPALGMLSSVQAGLPQLSPTTRGALIWPVDIPFVEVETVRQLLAADLAQPAVLVCKGRGGHPLWLPRELFAPALALPVELGLRALRGAYPPRRVEVEDEEILRDLDTPEDVERARRYWGGG